MRNAISVCCLQAAVAVVAVGVACDHAQNLSSPAAPSATVSSGGTAAKRPSDDIPVTTYIENVDGNGLPADSLNDAQGAYIHNAGGVRSVLEYSAYNSLSNGDWQFDLTLSTRQFGVSFDPEDAVQPGDPAYSVPAAPPYWGTQLVTGGFKVKCTLVNRSMRTMTAGTSFTCPLLNHIDHAGTAYGRQAAFSFTGQPGTTDVQVVCNAADGAGCSDWFIEPIGSGRAIARLSTDGPRPNKPNVVLGHFYLRFRVHITRP